MGVVQTPTPGTPTAPKGGTTTQNQTFPTPTNATEWAYTLLLAMGIDPAKNQNSLWDLTAQINYEWGSNAVVGNNPLASTKQEPSSGTPINSVGVQSYGNWLDGVAGNVEVLQQPNMAAMYKALQSNATITDYQAALGKSCWEGCGNGLGPNIAYGQGVAARFGSMAKGQSGGFAPLSKAFLDYASGGQIPKFNFPGGPGIGDIPAAAAGITGTFAQDVAKDVPWFGGINTLFKDLLDGFGIGWKAVLTIIGGILLIGVALIVMFHKQEGKAIAAVPMAAAA